MSLCVSVAAPTSAQERLAGIRGALVDRLSGEPLAGAEITLLGAPPPLTTSDPQGRFSYLGIPAGTYLLSIRSIGYTSASWVLVLAEGEILERSFVLEAAYQLDPVVVEGIADRRLAEFEARRQSRRGHFITAGDIQARGAKRLSDVLRTTPGVRLICRGTSCLVRMARGARECPPDYVVDGYPATYSTNAEMSLSGVIGIEVYRTLSETPLQFLRSDNRCGTIVIWTRSGL
jgi:hypothetical protein